MCGDEAELVLLLDGVVEVAVHHLQRLMLVIEESLAIEAVEVQVEEAGLAAASEQVLELSGLLGKDSSEVDCLHGVDGDALPRPLDGLRDFGGDTHDVCMFR